MSQELDIERLVRSHVQARRARLQPPNRLHAEIAARIATEARRPTPPAFSRQVLASIVLVALAIGLAIGLHFLRGSPQLAKPTSLARYDDGTLHFSYPSAWRPQKYADESSFAQLVTYLSPQNLHDPCTRTAGTNAGGPTLSITCGWPTDALPPGGVLLAWWEKGFPGWQLSQAPGDVTVIGGLPAKIDVARPGDCKAIGADETLTATIAIPPKANYYQLVACLRVPNVSSAESQVRALLRTTILTFGTPPPAPIVSNLLSAVDFVTPEVGWVVTGSTADPGARTILKTTDGGQHWIAQKSWLGSASLGRDNLLNIQLMFLDEQHGFILDANADQAVLYRTRDGGSSWQTLTLPGRPGPGSALSFVDPNDGFLLADVGAAMGQSSASVYRTSDGADHWTRVAHVDYGTVAQGLESYGDKDSLVFRSTAAGWLTAYTNAGPPALWATFNGGSAWADENLPQPPNIDFTWNGAPYPPAFFGTQLGVFPMVTTLTPIPTGQPTTVPPEGYLSVLYVYMTSDGGKHWMAPRRLPAVGSDQTPLYWHFLDANHWWVGTGDHIWITQDGGRTWKNETLVLAAGFIPVSLHFMTPQVGYVIVESGFQPGTFATAARLLKTTDGGLIWTEVSIPTAGS
jgi:photosystem II stability/assembly factor-like uncharacterized protein